MIGDRNSIAAVTLTQSHTEPVESQRFFSLQKQVGGSIYAFFTEIISSEELK